MADRLLEVDTIHTYIELYTQLVVGLIPNASPVAGFKADRGGNIYTGPSIGDTPTLVEPTAFSDDIAVVQVNEIVDDTAGLPRIDTPGSQADSIMQTDKPFYIKPLFTHDPHLIKPVHVLIAMMAIRDIYQRHNVQSLNHGINLSTAAIELIPSTYGKHLDLKGRICRNRTLNPHPTLVPTIGSSWVESMHYFGTELGMERYITTHPDVFFTGHDGSLRSNRMLCQLAGQYTMDLLVGATLQVDGDGHLSTVTRGHLTGFGGAPSMGHDPRDRHHATPAWLDITEPVAMLERGREFVMQTVGTFQGGGRPAFADTLDTVAVARRSDIPLALIVVYGDDVTRLLTEDGIVYLYKTRSLDKRHAMVAAVVSVTSIGLRYNPSKTERIRHDGLIASPEDLDMHRSDTNRELLAAKSIADLIE